MRSELFRIPIQWAGHPLFGIGWLLALWLVGSGLWLLFAAKRANSRAEVLSYLPGLLIGAVAIAVIPQAFPEGLPVRGYGVMVLLGSALGIWMASHRARQMGLHPEVILSLAFGMFVCGIVGARLFYVIEYWDTRFQFDDWPSTLLAIVKFTEGGLVVYGSLIGATLAFLWFVRKHHLPAFALADLIAPSLMAGLALGRIGCLLNGCCYGGETTRPWAVTFPNESMTYVEQMATGRFFGFRIAQTSAADQRPTVVAVDENSPAASAGMSAGMKIASINGRGTANLEQAQEALLIAATEQLPVTITDSTGKSLKIAPTELPARSRPVHPTQVYSAVNAALMAWLLWSFYPFRRRDGEVTALLLTLYPIARYLLEIIRIDESPVFGTGLSISQNISIAIFFAALALWLYLARQPQQRASFG